MVAGGIQVDIEREDIRGVVKLVEGVLRGRLSHHAAGF